MTDTTSRPRPAPARRRRRLRRLHARLRGLQGDQRRAPRRDRAARSRRCRHRREARPHQRALDEQQRILDELALKRPRPAVGGAAAARAPALRAQGGVRRLRARAARPPACASSRARRCRSAPSPDGGYLVPAETEAAVDARAEGDLADPRHRRRPPGLGRRLQEAVLDHGPRHRLGRRDRGAARDHVADARRALLPDHGALRHAGGDRDAARRRRRQHRRVDRRRGARRLRRAGRHRLRHRQRHQQAEGLPRLHEGRQRLAGPGATSAIIATGVGRRLPGVATRPTS